MYKSTTLASVLDLACMGGGKIVSRRRNGVYIALMLERLCYLTSWTQSIAEIQRISPIEAQSI